MSKPNERIVTLIDGSQVSNYSDEYRHECEARAILDIPLLQDRRAYLYGVEKYLRQSDRVVVTKRGVRHIRGQEAVKRLEDTMTTIWRLRQKASNDNRK